MKIKASEETIKYHSKENVEIAISFLNKLEGKTYTEVKAICNLAITIAQDNTKLV